jgi:hypothetical protein
VELERQCQEAEERQKRFDQDTAELREQVESLRKSLDDSERRRSELQKAPDRNKNFSESSGEGDQGLWPRSL